MHFLLDPKHHSADLLKQCDTLACPLQKEHFFSGFVFHLVQNVYHKPSPPAAGHLIFEDSSHYRCLSHPSVKSREQTQSKLSLLQKTGFVFFRKQYLVTHSKSCAPCLGFKDLHERMENLPFHLNLSPLLPGPLAWLDPKDFCLLPDILCTSVHFSLSVISYSLLYHGVQLVRLPCPSPTLELSQTHVHQVGDATQQFHPLSSPLPSAFNISLHEGLF